MNVLALGNWRTLRMSLSRPADEDLPALCSMEQDALTMATLGGVCTPAETAARLRRIQAHWDAHGFGWWIARERLTGKFLGRGGLRYVPLPEGMCVEVGYGFLQTHWNQGFATELAMESIRVGFSALGQAEIRSFTIPSNAASRRVMEKCGLQFVGNGVWADRPHVVYSIRRESWSVC